MRKMYLDLVKYKSHRLKDLNIFFFLAKLNFRFRLTFTQYLECTWMKQLYTCYLFKTQILHRWRQRPEKLCDL